MADVAKVAGVSKTTVSLVLSNAETRLAEDTRRRVRSVAKQLGYRRDLVASSLRTSQTRTIALLSDRLATTSVGWAMVAGAQAAARERGYMLLVANTEGDPEREVDAVQALRDRRVDGLVFGALFHRALTIPELTEDLPVVLLDAYDPDHRLSAVVPDDEVGGHDATALLTSAGHRRIGFINDDHDVPAVRLRLAGYRRALHEAGLAFDPDLVVSTDDPITPVGARTAVATLLDLPRPPTAVFCFNDRMASGVYQAARARGRSIPGDLSVVGFDDHEALAEGLDPPLTTMALPHEAMGRWAVLRLLALLDGSEDPEPVVHREPCPPVLRASHGPPPGPPPDPRPPPRPAPRPLPRPAPNPPSPTVADHRERFDRYPGRIAHDDDGAGGGGAAAGAGRRLAGVVAGVGPGWDRGGTGVGPGWPGWPGWDRGGRGGTGVAGVGPGWPGWG